MVSTLCGDSGGTSKPIDSQKSCAIAQNAPENVRMPGPFDGRHRKARENFRRIGELVERLDHGDARMRHQRAHHLVVAGERAGVRARGLLGARAAPGMHHDDRLAGTARAIGRGQERGRPTDVLDVDHDDAGRGSRR